MTIAAAKIRRNKDGRQRMSDLRAELAASKHMICETGSGWLVQRWSEEHQAYWQCNLDAFLTERQAIQYALYGEYEANEYAANFAR